MVQSLYCIQTDRTKEKGNFRDKNFNSKRESKMTISTAMNVEEFEIKQRSLASVKRARLKDKIGLNADEQKRVVRAGNAVNALRNEGKTIYTDPGKFYDEKQITIAGKQFAESGKLCSPNHNPAFRGRGKNDEWGNLIKGRGQNHPRLQIGNYFFMMMADSNINSRIIPKKRHLHKIKTQ